MRKPKKQNKPLNDLSRSLTPFDPNQTLIAVIDNASAYCAPFYVIRTPGFLGRDLMLAHGAVRSRAARADAAHLAGHGGQGPLACPTQAFETVACERIVGIEFE